MSKTRATIETILSQIEGHGPAENLSTHEVSLRLLGRNADASSQTDPCVQGTGESEDFVDLHHMQQQIETVNQLWNVECYGPIYSCRRVIGKLIVFCKRVIRKLTKFIVEPIVEQQVQFNAASANAFNALRNDDIAMAAQINELLKENRRLQNKLCEIEENLENFAASPDGWSGAETPYQSLDYLNFENHFRGSETEIKNNQRRYVPVFQQCRHVLDLGAGRGEFLELMRENGIFAEGVDLYKPFVEYVRKKGLAVALGEAVAYLSKQEDESFDGIFAAQLAEHLTTQQLRALCSESYRVLQSGGILVMETPNPTCVSTFLNNFYLDPTHIKPIHPKTLAYYLESAGFHDIRIEFTEESRIPYRLPLLNAEGANLNEFNDGVNALSDIIFGSQDYAIIAKK